MKKNDFDLKELSTVDGQTVSSDNCEIIEGLAKELMEFFIHYSKQVSHIADVLSSSGEYGILYMLYRDKCAYTAGELAEKLGLTPGRIANVLKALERKGRITRKREENDRRRINVAITPEGYEYTHRIFEESMKTFYQTVERIGIPDAQEFIRLTKEIFVTE